MTPCSGSCRAGLSDRPGPIPELSLFPDNLVLHSSALCWLTASRGVPSVFHYSQTHGGIKSTARGSSFPPLFFQYSNRCYLSRELLQSSPNRARVVSCRPGAEREGCETGGAIVEEHGKKGHGGPASRPKLEALTTDREYVPQDHDEQQLWEEEESAGKHPPSPPNCHESR